jgi:predicted TIM-barrel fold metal-dependent hydrolase
MVYLKTNRTGYSPEQVVRGTMTVGELINRLSEENPDDKIVFSNDEGYTYGAIYEDSIETD